MRFGKRAFLVPVLVVAVAIATLPTIAFGDRGKDEFHARLTGLNETPSINTAATGTARLSLRNDRIVFDVSWSNLTGDASVAHIHFGQQHVAGGVSAFFCGGGGKPACPTGTSGRVQGSIVAADVVGPSGQGINPGDLESLMRAIRQGATYSNVHTAKFANGEIRAQNKED